MPLKCRLGFHSWNKGCKCSACGKVRNEEHDWSRDPRKCAKCGLTRHPPHAWDGRKCSICGMERPLRPAGSERQPVEIEPTKADVAEAEEISRLIGYLNIYLPSEAARDAISLNLLNGVGETVAWQIAGWNEAQFLHVARRAAQEAGDMSRVTLWLYCQRALPTLLKYRYLTGDIENKILDRVTKAFRATDTSG